MLSSISSFLSSSPSEEDIKKVQGAIESLGKALQPGAEAPLLSLLKRAETQEKKQNLLFNHVETLLKDNGLTLSLQKIQLIFKEIEKNADVAQFMRENKSFKTWHPNAKLAFKLSLTLITIYCLPRWLLFLPCNMLFINPLVSHITKKCNLGLYASHFIQAFNLAASYFYYTPTTLATRLVKEGINQYGSSTYLIFPLSMLVREKGPAAWEAISDMAETSSDLLDLMGGVAEPEVAEKYDCLATADFSEAAAGAVSWLWDRAKNTGTCLANIPPAFQTAANKCVKTLYASARVG